MERSETRAFISHRGRVRHRCRRVAAGETIEDSMEDTSTQALRCTVSKFDACSNEVTIVKGGGEATEGSG